MCRPMGWWAGMPWTEMALMKALQQTNHGKLQLGEWEFRRPFDQAASFNGFGQVLSGDAFTSRIYENHCVLDLG